MVPQQWVGNIDFINVNSDAFLPSGVELSVSDEIIEGSKVRTQIWDTAGQERYKAVTNLYYR